MTGEDKDTVVAAVVAARGMETVEGKLEEGTRGEAAVGMAIIEAGGMATGAAAGNKAVVKDMEAIEMASEGTEGMVETEGRDKGKGTGIATEEEGMVNSRDIRQDREHQEHQVEGDTGPDRDIPVSNKDTGKDRVKGSRVVSTEEGRGQDTTHKAGTVRAAAVVVVVVDGDSARMRRARRTKGSVQPQVWYNTAYGIYIIRQRIGWCIHHPRIGCGAGVGAGADTRIRLSSNLVLGEKLRE